MMQVCTLVVDHLAVIKAQNWPCKSKPFQRDNGVSDIEAEDSRLAMWQILLSHGTQRAWWDMKCWNPLVPWSWDMDVRHSFGRGSQEGVREQGESGGKAHKNTPEWANHSHGQLGSVSLGPQRDCAEPASEHSCLSPVESWSWSALTSGCSVKDNPVPRNQRNLLG